MTRKSRGPAGPHGARDGDAPAPRQPEAALSHGLVLYAALAASLALNAAWVQQALQGEAGLALPWPLLGPGPPSGVPSGPLDLLAGLPASAEQVRQMEEEAPQGTAAEPLGAAAADLGPGHSSSNTSSSKGEGSSAGPVWPSSDPLAFPGEGICGSWAQQYSSLHRRMLQGEMPPKYLTFLAPRGALGQGAAPPLPPGGVGDSLMGVVSAFLAALLLNRALIIADPALADTMSPNRVDWRVTDRVPMNSTVHGKGGRNPPPRSVKRGSVVLLEFLSRQGEGGPGAEAEAVTFPQHILRSLRPYNRASNLLLRTNGGVVTSIFSGRSGTFRALFQERGLRLPLTVGCILRFLLSPRAHVLEPIRRQLQLLQQPRTSSICVGMQGAGPALLATPTAPTPTLSALQGSARALLRCAASVEEYWLPPGRHVHWLLSSDSADLRDYAAQLHPHRVMLLGNTTGSQALPPTGSEELAAAVGEWILFSLCQYYVIADSTFAKSSFAFNIWAPLVFLFPPLRQKEINASCEPSHGHSYLKLKQWSGL